MVTYAPSIGGSGYITDIWDQKLFLYNKMHSTSIKYDVDRIYNLSCHSGNKKFKKEIKEMQKVFGAEQYTGLSGNAISDEAGTSLIGVNLWFWNQFDAFDW